VVLFGQLLDQALHLVLADVDPQRARLALHQLLVDQLRQSLAEQLLALRLARSPGREPGQLGRDAILHFGQGDRGAVHHRRDPVLDLGGSGERDERE
jgi:hypothetical protein